MKCENCSIIHDGKFGSGRFCSVRCSRSFATKFKRQEINKIISEKFKGILFGSGVISKETQKKMLETRKRNFIKKTYENISYENLSYKKRKEILWNEQNKKCNHCEYNLLDEKTGPYQIHHKDGNRLNLIRENEELLCYNCHYVTNNFGFKNKNHKEETKIKISKSLKVYYKRVRGDGCR